MSYTESKAQQHSSTARAVVAIDFGTTFSGFAYAKTSEPDNIFKCYEWPCAGKAGGKPYCKTQTSLYYIPCATREGHFELKDWSWSGLLELTQASRAAKLSHVAVVSNTFLTRGLASSSSAPSQTIQNVTSDVLGIPEGFTEKVGFFATNFKLHLAPDGQFYSAHLPGDLTVDRMIVDYLHCISDFILLELQVKYGKHFSKVDVQWCLTVPAIWDERAKQVMKVCAEMAGIVGGASCPTPNTASPYPLDIVLEPEAASIYCQKKAKSILNIKQGDRLLVADIGGGTIDLVVHEKADEDPESMRVHEVVGSYGSIGGGTFVDSHFFHFLSKKIGCFKQFCRESTSVGLNVYGWWQSIKMGFDGRGYSAELPLPRKLSEAWERHDKLHGISWNHEEYYNDLRLEDTDIMAIFDLEVEKVLSLIEKHIEGARVLMVVGGFSASPYLRKCVQSRFKGKVEEIIIPEDPGSAICHGAVQLHMGNDIIQSRIAKRTYGIRCNRPAELGDPPGLLFVNNDGIRTCGSTFSVFATVGDRVPLNATIKKRYRPSVHRQIALGIPLHSTPSMFPKFTTEEDVLKEGSFVVDISEGLELDKEREVEVSMCFGASLVRVDAKRLNFGNKDIVEPGLSVKFSA